MTRQAALKEVEAGSVVGFLFKLKASAVLHELTELTWVASTQLLQRSLNLLFLDVDYLLEKTFHSTEERWEDDVT